MKYHLMTMDINGVDPFYHGIVDIDSNNIITSEPYAGTPVEDYGCFFYSIDPFDTDQDAMFKKFLSLMS